MGQSSSRLKDLPEQDLFQLYFSTSQRVDQLDLMIPSPDQVIGFSSLIYRLQVVSDNQVLDEITVTVDYRPSCPRSRLRFRKHLQAQRETPDDLLDQWENAKVGFPRRDYYLTTSAILQFSAIVPGKYLIHLIEGGYHHRSDYYQSRVLGTLELKRLAAPPFQDLHLEPIVETVLRVPQKIQTPSQYQITLSAPLINSQSAHLELSHFAQRSLDRSQPRQKIMKAPLHTEVTPQTRELYSLLPMPRYRTQLEIRHRFPALSYHLSGLESVY